MEMHEADKTGEKTTRTSLDDVTLPHATDTAEQTRDVVIANQAANAIVTKDINMDPSLEEPFIVDDDLNHPKGNGKPNQGIMVFYNYSQGYRNLALMTLCHNNVVQFGDFHGRDTYVQVLFTKV
jgi:hypothetical protein